MDKEDLFTGNKRYLLLFDGVCNLCNEYVQFIVQRDPNAQFVFAPLQSKIGKKVLEQHGYSSNSLNTVMLLKKGILYKESDVALEVTKDLSGLWPSLAIFKLIPSFIRNPIYRWIAKNRYRWFGKKETCMVPTPELQARFFSN